MKEYKELVEAGVRIVRRALFTTLYVGVILLIWQGVVIGLNVRSYLLPPPLQVIQEFYRLWKVLFQAAAVTLLEALAGFLLAALVGISLGVLVVYSPLLRRAVMPILVAINAAPKVAVAPLLIVWLGVSLQSKIAMALLMSFFPIVINTVAGLTDVDRELLSLFRLIKASTFQTFVKIRLPNAVPAIFDGFKIALPISVIGAIVGEYVGARAGIGYQIVLASSSFNTALVFAAVILIASLTAILFWLVGWLEDRLVYWRVSKR